MGDTASREAPTSLRHLFRQTLLVGSGSLKKSTLRSGNGGGGGVIRYLAIWPSS